MKQFTFFSFLVFVLISINTIYAQDYYVSTTGNNETNDGSSGEPFLTIAHAISIATADQEISVATGTYTETNLVIDKNLTFTGNGPGNTIIQAQGTVPDGITILGNESIFHVQENANLTLNSLTLQHGNSSETGSAIRVVSGGSVLTIDTCNILNSYSSANGGAILAQGTIVINNSTIAKNTAGGNKGGAIATFGDFTLTNSLFYQNQAHSTTPNNSGGGAIFAENNITASINNCTFAYNLGATTSIHAMNNGLRFTSAENLTITNSIFFNSVDNNITTSGQDIGWGTVPVNGNYNNNIYSFTWVTCTECSRQDTDPASTAANVKLGTFIQNGNGLWTLPLLEGSIAIDTAESSTATALDMHGSAVSGTKRDIGAFEYSGVVSTEQKTIENANLYPSPSQGTFTLSLPGVSTGKIEGFSITGQKIHSQKIEDEKTLVTLDPSVSGIVVIRFSNNEYNFAIKHIVK